MQDVWAVVWRDGSAIEGVSVYDTAHRAVHAIIAVWPNLTDRFETDENGKFTGAEDEDADTEFDDFWLESCRVNA